MPLTCLISWIGRQDLDGAARQPPAGPIVDFLRVHPGLTVVLLSDWPKHEEAAYLSALRRAVTSTIQVHHAKLKDPTDYLGIFRAADQALGSLVREVPVGALAIHTSPGTSAMAAVWILLAKTKYAGAKLFKSWLDKAGTPQLAEVEIPFDLTLDVLPDLAARRAALLAPSDAALPATNAFDALIHQSPAMAAVIRDARRAALYPNPVLLLGESGTGKELLARAIHAASLRAENSWGAMNCGAIPRDLLDAELFGHVKGAFTGATTDRAGRFEACNGGTLFLDEVGEMPPETQVRLLRVMQEGEIQRVGETKARKIDVRQRAIGLVSRCKVGDFVLTLGPESAASGACIVFEAKEDRSYDLHKMIDELAQARENRGAQVGIAVLSKATAPEGIEPLTRFGADIIVVWDRDDTTSDILFTAALSLARALVVRERTQQERVEAEFTAIEDAVRRITKAVESMSEIMTWSETIRSNGAKIHDRAERLRDDIGKQLDVLRQNVEGLKDYAGQEAAAA